MRQMAVLAFTALEQCELSDLLPELKARVFDRSPQDLMDVALIDGVWEWRFKPMLELLLRHVIAAAGDSARTTAERKREIMWAVEMVGF